MTDDPITCSDDLCDLREGAVVTLKGKLEAARWYTGWRSPDLVLVFLDWTMVVINVVDKPTAKSIRIPLQSHVTVKARVIDEDGTLEAIAIWTPGGAPQPLVSCDTTESVKS